MARVRDFFAQRGGVNDTERDESSPEAKQPVQEEPPEEKHSDVQSFAEESSQSEGSPFVAESLKTCKTPTHDVLHDSSPAHDYIANGEPEKSESFNLANTATLTGGESATDARNKPLHPNEYAPAECQNINKSVSKAEESSQGMSNECIRYIAAEPAGSVISAMSSESLASMATSFTFGTVVAPLYQQVFGRVGSESQRVGDWGNPAQAALNVGGLTQSYPHTDRRETSCTVPPDARGNKDKVHGDVIKTQESKQECLHATLNSTPVEEEETSLSVTENDILDHAETLQDPGIHSDQRCTDDSVVPKTILGDTVVYPHTENILNADVSYPQIPTESLHLQGEAQEDDVTHDLQSQTTAVTAQAQLPEHTCTQVKTDLCETHAQSEKEVITSAETSFMSLQPSQRVPERVSDETDQQTSSSQSNGYKCVPQISHEETHDVEEENKEAMMSIYIHGETLVELKDENTLKCEEIVLEEIEHHEIEAAVSKQEDFCLADASEVKNWEMMVEEEEKNILTDEEESRATSSKAEDIEPVEKDQGEQLEDAGTETASENIDTTEIEKEKTDDKMVGKITAAREEENKTEDADPIQGKQQMGEEQIGEIVAGKYREEVEKESEYVEATKIAGEEELAEETEIEKNKGQEETELENEKHFAEKHEVTVERINAQEEEEIEGEKEMEIDLNNDEEAGVDCEDQVKAREEYVEEANPDCKEEILVDEMSVIVDAELESMKIGYKENEVGCFEERLDIKENKAEDDLSAPVNDVQDKRVSDEENTGEGQNAHMTSEMHLYKEEAFHNNVNGTHDLSKAARDETKSSAAEGGSRVFADEPENDQLSHDSASAESDSEDEVELYMHCLRAVHTGAQAHKDKNRDTGFSVGKSVGFSISRSKLLSTPMPSISESLDEEQPLSRLQDRHEDTETADIQTIAAALPASSGQGSINKHVSWWKESFSCSDISKTLLYATLLVLFVVVAYYYDFLACFGLYVISVIWLCCQGERQPVKNNRIG